MLNGQTRGRQRVDLLRCLLLLLAVCIPRSVVVVTTPTGGARHLIILLTARLQISEPPTRHPLCPQRRLQLLADTTGAGRDQRVFVPLLLLR